MHVRTRTWLGFVVAASLLFLAAGRLAVFDPLENAVLSVIAPVDDALRAVTRPMADFVNNLTDINRLSDENQSLREENERLTSELVRLREVERELQEIRQMLALREGEEHNFVGANVFAYEPSNQKDAIAIDRGSSDGLQEGMVAITRQGSLVGSVTRVLDDVAWITLITDPTSAVSAFIQESQVQGVVAGSPDGTLTMEFVEETAEVKEGDLVLTSGVGGSYPPRELIGQVVEVEQAAQDLFQSVTVQPLADLSRLDTVLVLTSFFPLEPGEP
jgi:rod shape-determining protein MreC